jgi:hypothetical protein
MDAPDHPIPLHLSDQHGTFDQDPVARVKRGKMLIGDLGFRRGGGSGVVHSEVLVVLRGNEVVDGVQRG